LARSNKDEALRFVDYLQGWARRSGHSEYSEELTQVLAEVQAAQTERRRTWFD
jgi:hypothetical protein